MESLIEGPSQKRVKLDLELEESNVDDGRPNPSDPSRHRQERRKVGRRRLLRNNELGPQKPVEGDGTTTIKSPRLPKRQCALLIGFCGTGCSGMQFQKDQDVPTIEGILFGAMVKAGAISQQNADDPVKVNLARAARTDAGVHAAGNVVSIKMIVDVPGVPDMCARINEELPPEIRVWGFVRVQNSFNARTACDSRKYIYFFPSYLLLPPKPGSNLERVIEETSGLPNSDVSLPHPFWSVDDANLSTKENDLIRKRQWRVGATEMDLLRTAARKFQGTHNFHNFTSGKEYNDPSNQRHIKVIRIDNPAIYGNTEWISVMLHGQSFMLHQRKMISILVLSIRTRTPFTVIEKLYGPRVVFIPKMPSIGLLLDQPVFDSYNAKVSKINENLQSTDPDHRPPIDFDLHREDIEAFKKECIYSKMRAIEDQFGLFDAWIRSTDSYSGNDLLYLNRQGVIPDAAAIKKGERRSNPFRERKRFDSTHFPRSVANTATIDEEDEEGDEDDQSNTENVNDVQV